MSLFVDTSVWSLALRRDRPPDVPEVARHDISALLVYVYRRKTLTARVLLTLPSLAR